MPYKGSMFKLLSVLGLLLPLLLGCARFRHVEGLEVSLTNMRFTDATLLETTGEFTLRVENESPAPVLLNGAVHKIYLNGLYIGKGLTSQSLEVPRLGSATQDVTIHLQNLSLATRLRAILEQQAIDYRVATIFYMDTPRGTRKCSASSQGTLALRDFTPPSRQLAPP